MLGRRRRRRNKGKDADMENCAHHIPAFKCKAILKRNLRIPWKDCQFCHHLLDGAKEIRSEIERTRHYNFVSMTLLKTQFVHYPMMIITGNFEILVFYLLKVDWHRHNVLSFWLFFHSFTEEVFSKIFFTVGWNFWEWMNFFRWKLWTINLISPLFFTAQR